VGDGMNDINLAKNSGILSCIYLNGLGKRQDLLAAHADFYCENISEINTLFY
jgi:phosphoglycolate phosphatase